jgi:hypothetical protein
VKPLFIPRTRRLLLLTSKRRDPVTIPPACLLQPAGFGLGIGGGLAKSPRLGKTRADVRQKYEAERKELLEFVDQILNLTRSPLATRFQRAVGEMANADVAPRSVGRQKRGSEGAREGSRIHCITPAALVESP